MSDRANARAIYFAAMQAAHEGIAWDAVRRTSRILRAMAARPAEVTSDNLRELAGLLDDCVRLAAPDPLEGTP